MTTPVRTYSSARAGAVLDCLEADIDLWFVETCSRRNVRIVPGPGLRRIARSLRHRRRG
ncbi:MAG: hypothetical protein ACYCW6_09745 [Candidatus Xenobia bacterium]